jgi:hypothetical protein
MVLPLKRRRSLATFPFDGSIDSFVELSIGYLNGQLR